MTSNEPQPTREQLIKEHLEAIQRLTQVDAPETRDSSEGSASWPPRDFYMLWHVLIGMMLGFIAAAVSLLSNVIAAPLADEHPLQLIRVYLTFPMGEAALSAGDAKVLTVGCILYLVTGGLYGIAFHLLMTTQFAASSRKQRFVIGSILGLGLWIVNFYLILSWLQPMLLGGNWIVREVPTVVAAATHLAFAWTMLLLQFWGRFDAAAYGQGAA